MGPTVTMLFAHRNVGLTNKQLAAGLRAEPQRAIQRSPVCGTKGPYHQVLPSEHWTNHQHPGSEDRPVGDECRFPAPYPVPVVHLLQIAVDCTHLSVACTYPGIADNFTVLEKASRWLVFQAHWARASILGNTYTKSVRETNIKRGEH